MSAASILVVDDEADIRGLVKEILSEEGYEVEVASNGAEARSLRQRQQPDLILLDIWMPDVDGITLLREWSAAASNGCPVVMMSGHGTVETAVEATRLGAIDYVEKPLSLAKLLRTVRKALEEELALEEGGQRMDVQLEPNAEIAASELAARLLAQGFRLSRLQPEEISLETAFMRLTKGLVS